MLNLTAITGRCASCFLVSGQNGWKRVKEIALLVGRYVFDLWNQAIAWFVPAMKQRADPISPEEQLFRLVRPIILSTFSDGMCSPELIKYTAQAVLRHSGASDANQGAIPLMQRCIEQLMVDQPLPPILTSWYIALKRLNLLPEKIPPLPDNIVNILLSPCPIKKGKQIKDTHILTLVPREAGNLNKFEQTLRRYGEQHYPQNENPLQYRYFSQTARYEHGTTPFRPTHWVLMTNGVLPGSRNKTFQTQLKLIENLSKRAGAEHEAPTLQQAVTAMMTHKVATGVTLYRAGNAGDNYLYTCTRVQERTNNCPLIVGGFAPSGLSISYDYIAHEDFGVAARRKFA